MDNIKKCIFHIPTPIQDNGASASSIRPFKMLEAFNNIGYDVEVISGYSDERKEKINVLKEKIRNGGKYDFVYSESSTMPTMLTDPNHLPKNFNLDFNFFKFCKQYNIPVGLFYRDIHWRFPIYKNSVTGIKRLIALFFYKYDLKQYKKNLKYLFVPTYKMCEYLDQKSLPKNIAELPPGTTEVLLRSNNASDNSHEIHLLYVGGIGEIYQFDKLLKVVSQQKNVQLTVCCREQDWEKNKATYIKYVSDNICVVHKSGEELKELYDNCDICMAFFKCTAYMAMAMPVKIFEYLSYRKPIIATQDTAAGEFVEKQGIGWSIKYDCDELHALLNNILNNRAEIKSINSNIEKQVKLNTWEKRAEQVVDLLIN